jgi:hypothetical protein
MTDGIRVFISHSSRDSKLVECLIKLLRSALVLSAKQIRCTSIDGHRLPGGAHTEEQLRTEVVACDLLIGVISEDSIASVYVVFELGARWGGSRPFIPVLAPKASPELLAGPLHGINALRLDAEHQVQQLLEDCGGILRCELESPAAYRSQLNDLLKVGGATKEPTRPVPARGVPPEEGGTAVQRVRDEMLGDAEWGLSVDEIVRLTGYKLSTVRQYLSTERRQDLGDAIRDDPAVRARALAIVSKKRSR